MLSQTIQFLSELETLPPTLTGLSQVKPPSLDRLTTTAGVEKLAIGKLAMIQTLCLAS